MRYKFLDAEGKTFSLRVGKIASQASHSAMAFLLKSYGTLTAEQEEWIRTGQTKICVRVDTEEELNAIEMAAKEAGLTVHSVIDEGRTEFRGIKTKTCIAIGPNESELIDKITGNLKLL